MELNGKANVQFVTEIEFRDPSPQRLLLRCRPDGLVIDVLRDDVGGVSSGASVQALFELDQLPTGFPSISTAHRGRQVWSLEWSLSASSLLLLASTPAPLLETENAFKRVVESMHDGYVRTDLRGRITMANASAASLLGYENWTQLLDVDHRTLYADPSLYKIMEWALVERGELTNYLNQIRRKDGSLRTFEGDLKLTPGENGFVEIIFRDATARLDRDLEQRQARRAAEIATRSKADFLATMSHEIRTPLNGVLGMVHLMCRTELDQRQRDYLSKTSASAQMLLRVVNDILDFSKGEAGRLVLDDVPFELDELLENLISVVITRVEEKQLEMFLSVAADVPRRLVGDGNRLGQILLNLVGNAIKFTEHGQIAIEVSQELPTPDSGVRLRFAVRDTGPGLSPEQASKLFQAYTQADPTISGKYGGTGLGLAISRRLVELMGGEIGLTSQPGAGSCFVFSARFGLVEGVPEIGLEVRPKTLVVDDNSERREHLTRSLRALGLSVQPASTLDESCVDDVELLLIEGSNAVVLDSIVRNAWKRIGIISSYQELESHLGRVGSIVDGVIQRPFTRSSLQRALANILDPNGAAQPSLALEVGQVPFRGARVLLVEDNLINQQIARELLEGYGLEVDLATDGQQAVTMLENTSPCPFRLVLMDIQMPTMDGLTATRLIRQNPRLHDLPIVAMTAHVLGRERALCLEVGMNGYLSKPIEPATLLAALKSWMPISEPDPPPLEPLDELSIPGVDSSAGIRRTGGRQGTYTRLLAKFAAEQLLELGGLEQAVKDGDQARVRFLAHSLRGAAANLGIAEVARLAGILENAPLESSGDTFGLLQAASLEVCRGISQTVGATGPSGLSSTRLSLEETQRLRQMLMSSDGAALDYLARILDEAGRPARYAALDNLVESYEFGAAAEELARLEGEEN